MDILYISRLTSERLVDVILRETGKNPGFAIQKFSRLLTKGLLKNDTNVYSLSSPPYNRCNTSKRYIKISDEVENGVAYSYIPIVNLPIIKSIVDFIYVFIYIFKWNKNNKDHKAVIFDVLNISACISGIMACKMLRIQTVGIVTDMPSLLSARGSFLGRMVSKLNNSFLSSFDKYVFITEQMNTDINSNNRPYIVMEGLVDSSMSETENEASQKKHPREILYAGGLYEKFGIKTLIDAVKSLHRSDIKLVLYGSGPMVEELNNDDFSGLEYRGVAPNNEVMKAEIESTLLVNPRPTHEAFTRYSFPSKNMEYMTTGTPLLTTRLPGMPAEYHSFVYLFDEETVEGYARKIEEIISYSDEMLQQKGKAAKQFVIENKNEKVQGRRVLDLISICNK